MRIDGHFSGVHGSARDINERERLEAELRESEERYRYLVQSSPDLVWVTDAEGRFTFISDQAQQILGWSPEELIGRSFVDLAPPAGVARRARPIPLAPAAADGGAPRHGSGSGPATGGSCPWRSPASGCSPPTGRSSGAHGAARDVSERERLEGGLRRQAAELASSEERAHLARELHDSVTQALFSMTLISRSIELLLDRDPSAVPAKLASLRDLQREALAEMRALIFELRPGNVEEHGLIQALRTHSASLSGRIGLPVVVEGELTERPSIEVEETLYRIAQEALHNVVKHAGAREVRLDVSRDAEGVRVRVEDDGRGFDPTTVPDGHLGLAGMRSRAERLGGRLTVTAAPGRGTVIEVVVPEVVPRRARVTRPRSPDRLHRRRETRKCYVVCRGPHTPDIPVGCATRSAGSGHVRPRNADGRPIGRRRHHRRARRFAPGARRGCGRPDAREHRRPAADPPPVRRRRRGGPRRRGDRPGPRAPAGCGHPGPTAPRADRRDRPHPAHPRDRAGRPDPRPRLVAGSRARHPRGGRRRLPAQDLQARRADRRHRALHRRRPVAVRGGIGRARRPRRA